MFLTPFLGIMFYFADGTFNGFTISDAGSDGIGSSTAAGAPNWTDGDPAYIEATAGGGIGFQWRDTGMGTQLNNTRFFPPEAALFGPGGGSPRQARMSPIHGSSRQMRG